MISYVALCCYKLGLLIQEEASLMFLLGDRAGVSSNVLPMFVPARPARSEFRFTSTQELPLIQFSVVLGPSIEPLGFLLSSYVHSSLL
jgi:hypothetical protein